MNLKTIFDYELNNLLSDYGGEIGRWFIILVMLPFSLSLGVVAVCLGSIGLVYGGGPQYLVPFLAGLLTTGIGAFFMMECIYIVRDEWRKSKL